MLLSTLQFLSYSDLLSMKFLDDAHGSKLKIKTHEEKNSN